jgi:hypothetical protein
VSELDVDLEGLVLTRRDLRAVQAALDELPFQLGDVCAAAYESGYLAAIRASPPDGTDRARFAGIDVAGAAVARAVAALGLEEASPWR